MGRGWRRLGAAVVAVGLALAAGVASAAEEAKPAEKGPNTGAVSVLMGMDWTTDYYFRGILQADEGWILQPYGEITFKLLENLGALNTLGLTIGSWNSLQGGPSGIEGGSAKADPKMWYESDFYVRVGAQTFEDLTTAIIYTAYMSPNDSFQTVQELAFSAAYNDSKLLGPFALNPNALLAFEVKGQADAGAHRGVYLQFGIAPGLTVLEKTDYPISLAVPVNFGFSLSKLLRVRHRDGRRLRVVEPGADRGDAAEVHSAALRQLAGQGLVHDAPPRRRQFEGREQRRFDGVDRPRSGSAFTY